MRIINRITGIEGVTTGNSPRVKIRVNRRIHQLKFFFTLAGVATAVAGVLDRVRVFVNGNTIWDISAANALRIPALNALTAATGELILAFSEPWRADKVDEQLTALDLFGEGSCEVEFVLLSGVSGTIGLTGIEIFDYGQTLVDGKPAKHHIRRKELGKNALAGLNDFDNLPTLLPIHRILLQGASVSLASVEVTADGNRVHDTLRAENAQVLNDYGLVATAFSYPVCFDFTEQILGEALVVRNDLNVRFNSSGAQAVVALIEQRAANFGT